jgi:hypothetical protein
MSSARTPLLVLLGAALVGVGLLSSITTTVNPSTLPNGFSTVGAVESAALYCTGLTSAKGGAPGRVIFLNTTDSSRSLTVNVVSDTGKSYSTIMKIAPMASASIDPSAVLSGNDFGVAAQVSGGGVVGEEVTRSTTGLAPCVSTGVADWYAAGFDTTVGSSANLSIYNPTATPAVLNVSTYSKSGFIAPATFQGISVGAHAQFELNLGNQIVNTANVGVRVRVVRGTLDIVGVQQSGSTTSFNAGLAGPSTTAQFPRVTTARDTTVQVRLANPGAKTARVTLDVALPPYHVAPLTLTVPAYASGLVSITPNPAIPAAGYATVQLTSTVPVTAALAAGGRADVAITSPGTPGSQFLISSVLGARFNAATVTNTSARSVTLHFYDLQSGATSSTELAGATTVDLSSVYRAGVSGRNVLVTASRPVLLVTLTLPSKPVGVIVVAPLDGR